VKFQDNIMLPHAWTEEVCVTSRRARSLDGDCIMFEEWDQVGSSKIFLSYFYFKYVVQTMILPNIKLSILLH
jgi:hypothetical protein